MKLLYSIHKYDVFIFTWLTNARMHTTLITTGRYISKTGDGSLYLIIAGLLYWREGFDSPFLQALLLAFLIERPIYFVRGVAIFAKAFMSIPAQQAAKTTRPLMPAAAPAVLVTRSLPNKG